MAEINISLSDVDVDRIAAAVAAKLAECGSPAGKATLPGKTLWREDEAAECLGVSAAWLKKLRLRGYIQASTNERPILYSRKQLDTAAEFLVKHAAGE